MAHVDDDEFLSFNFAKSFKGKRLTSLTELIAEYEHRYSNLSALYFMPINIIPCQFNGPVDYVTNRSGNHTSLPRFGRWRGARTGVDYEGKMIMRTEAIGMFYVHYITLREEGSWNYSAFVLPYSVGAMLHYRLPPELSGSISGALLPMHPSGKPLECLRRQDDQLSVEGAMVLRKMSRALLPLLRDAYVARREKYGAA